MADVELRKNKNGGWFDLNAYLNKFIRKSYLDKNTMIKTIKEENSILNNDKRHKYIINRHTGIIMGELDYHIDNNTPTIDYIRVYEEYKRKGYGTKLVQSLQKDYRGKEINFDIITKEGKPFFDSVAEYTEVKKGEYDYHYKGKIKGVD